MLSDISTIVDPLGLLTPVTLKLKLIMQSGWVRGVDWDEELPSDVQSEFMKWRKTLPVITKLNIPRLKLKKRFELHLFCDAPELAYAACIYVRCLDTQEINFLVSKSKVPFLKPLHCPKIGTLCSISLMKFVESCPTKFGEVSFRSRTTSWIDELYFGSHMASSDPAKLEYLHCQPCPSNLGHPEDKTLEACPK